MDLTAGFDVLAGKFMEKQMGRNERKLKLGKLEARNGRPAFRKDFLSIKTNKIKPTKDFLPF